MLTWHRVRPEARWSVATVALCLALVGCSGTSTPDKTEDGGSATARAGLSSKIAQQVAGYKEYKSLRALIVMHDSETAYEKYYDSSADESRNIFSVTKSVMSTLVGIALAEGSLKSLDQTLDALLPSYAAGMTPSVAKTTLRQVITMTAGFPGATYDDIFEWQSVRDWTQGVLTRQVSKPGETFGYSDGGAHLLSAILIQATGLPVLDYARTRLFDPMGIRTRPAGEGIDIDKDPAAYARAGFAWPVDPQGRHDGWAHLKLLPRDMAKLGRLFLDQGRWEGKQLVPVEWVRDATTAHVKSYGVTSSYGYMWWVFTADDEPAYAAWGHGGQMIAVVPGRHLVVVASTAINRADPDDTGVYPYLMTDLVSSFIAPAFRP